MITNVSSDTNSQLKGSLTAILNLDLRKVSPRNDGSKITFSKYTTVHTRINNS